MSSAIVSGTKVRQLDKPSAPDQQVTADDAADSQKLARLLTSILASLADIKRRFWPKRIDYEDQVTTGTGGSPQTLPYEHGFGGRVRFWVVDWSGTTAAPILVRDSTLTTNDKLVLKSYEGGTFTLRVEEAG